MTGFEMTLVYLAGIFLLIVGDRIIFNRYGSGGAVILAISWPIIGMTALVVVGWMALFWFCWLIVFCLDWVVRMRDEISHT